MASYHWTIGPLLKGMRYGNLVRRKKTPLQPQTQIKLYQKRINKKKPRLGFFLFTLRLGEFID